VNGKSVNRITERLDFPEADEMEIIAQQRFSAIE
jgi:hypothetical protein